MGLLRRKPGLAQQIAALSPDERDLLKTLDALVIGQKQGKNFDTTLAECHPELSGDTWESAHLRLEYLTALGEFAHRFPQK